MASRWRNSVTIGALFMATFSLSACTDEGASPAGPAIDTDRVTTDPDVALANLDARIRGIEAAVARRPDDVLLRRLAVEQLLSRAAFTGSYGDDFARAEALVAGAGQGDDAARHRLVARLASALHRFDDAQDALDRAAGLGQEDPDAEVTTAVAVGLGLPEALRRAEAAAADRLSLDTYVALGAAESALGMFDAADRHFRLAADAVIDPSPFVVAYVAFQRGVMWAELADRPDLARPLYEAAVRLRNETGQHVEACPFDLKYVDDIAGSYESLIESDGPADILVNAAGMSNRGPAEELTIDAFTETITLNLTAPFALSQAFARPLLEAKHPGCIVNIASLMSHATRPGTSPYTASKGGLAMLTKALACDWAPHGILVNAVAPGYIHTELTDKLRNDPNFDAWVRSRSLLGRWGDPMDIARPVVFLASPAAGFINGQVIYVDGGWTAHL